MTEKKDERPVPADQDSNFLDVAFKAGISAAEDIHKRAFDIPLHMLEGMGAPKDKVDMLRDKSQALIGELYSAINSVAAQVGPIKPPGTTKEVPKDD